MRGEQPRRFQVVLGPRRVGKTTAMYQTVASLLKQRVPPASLNWFRLDHPVLLPFSLGDLIQALLNSRPASEAEPMHVFLDELTYAEDWDKWLKTFHDERWPVRIVATSSSTASL